MEFIIDSGTTVTVEVDRRTPGAHLVALRDDNTLAPPGIGAHDPGRTTLTSRTTLTDRTTRIPRPAGGHPHPPDEPSGRSGWSGSLSRLGCSRDFTSSGGRNLDQRSGNSDGM